MKKIIEAEAEEVKKINGRGSGSGSDKKLPLPDTLKKSDVRVFAGKIIMILALEQPREYK